MTVDEQQRTAPGAAASSRRATAPGETPALGEPTPVARDDWRSRIREKPGIGQLYRAGVFVAGLVFILLGVVLAALPGPLTIPPVLFGLWIWSTEFRWAKRFFDAFKRKARDAWAHAKTHPLSSAAMTIGGLVAAGAAIWAVQHFELVARGRDAVGI